MDAVDKGYALFQPEPRRALVGGEHKVLDHLLRGAPLIGHRTDADILLVYDEHTLLGLQLGSASRYALFIQLVRQLLHHRQLGDDLPVLLVKLCVLLACQQAVYLAVNALHPGADNALGKFVVLYPGVLVQLDEAGERQPVLSRIEGADAVGKLRRQHRNNAVCVVDAGAPLEGLVVQRRLGCDVVGNVRDVDAQLVAVLCL